MGSSERGKSLDSCLEAAEAAEKWYQKGPEGPEKVKGQKLEGKGHVILLMSVGVLVYKAFFEFLLPCEISMTDVAWHIVGI